MRNFFLLFFFLLCIFSVSTQEQDKPKSTEKKEITFSIDETSKEVLPTLIVSKDGFLGIGFYKFLNGEPISYNELNQLLKYQANPKFVRRMSISRISTNALLLAFFASIGVSLYADSKGWEDMSTNSFLIGEACFAGSFLSDLIYLVNRSHAIESYNLKLLGLESQ